MAADVQNRPTSFNVFKSDHHPLLGNSGLGHVFETTTKRSAQGKRPRKSLSDVQRSAVPPMESDYNLPNRAALLFRGVRAESRNRSRLGMQSQASFFVRHNPHPTRVRHIEGLNGAPICAVHDHDFFTLPRIAYSTAPLREYRSLYKDSQIGRPPFHNYPFKEKAVPHIGLIPMTTNWRNELRDLCNKAGLVTDDINMPPRPPTPPRSPSRRSVYSADTGRLLPPPSRALTRQSVRSATSHSRRNNYSHITPTYFDNESLMLEFLCQILQTDSLQVIQQWLVSASDREKALVLDMLKTAMFTEEDTPEQPQEVTVPTTRNHSRVSARSHEDPMPEKAENRNDNALPSRRMSRSSRSRRSSVSREKRNKRNQKTPEKQGTLRLQKGSLPSRKFDPLPAIEENLQPQEGDKEPQKQQDKTDS